MKSVLVILILILTITSQGRNMNITEKFLDALIQVESKGDPTKVGRYGELGILQIKQCVIDDVNNKVEHANIWTINDVLDNQKAKTICRKYLSYWGSHYEKTTGKTYRK